MEHSNPAAGPIQEVPFTYSQVTNQRMAISIIDHFAGNETLFNTVVDAGVIHSGDDPSSHTSIFTKLKMQDIEPSIEKSLEKIKLSKRQSTGEEQLQ